jgi:DNA-binding HxlR family transcriptional regulator
MSNEKKPKKSGKTKAPMGFEEARVAIVQNLQKGGAKGATSLAAKTLVTANQTVFDEALATLEREGVAIVDREKIKPKYYLKELAPSHRESILAKLRKAGSKGSAALYTKSASAAARKAIERDAAALESEGVIVFDRNGAKPKYYLKEFAPKLEPVCARLEAFAAAKYPQLLSEFEMRKALAKEEVTLFDRALYWLESQREIVRLQHGKSTVFASARALRSALGGESAEIPGAAPFPDHAASSEPIFPSEDIDAGRICEAYRVLAEQSGFPSVKIAVLQRESGTQLAALQRWLRNEYQQGRAVLSFGDWSLSDEATRAAAIELRGESYLLVKLQQ